MLRCIILMRSNKAHAVKGRVGKSPVGILMLSVATSCDSGLLWSEEAPIDRCHCSRSMFTGMQPVERSALEIKSDDLKGCTDCERECARCI